PDDQPLDWAQIPCAYALLAQPENGSAYLIDADYYNTDLAADERRALVLLYDVSQRSPPLHAPRLFTDLRLSWHAADGSSPLPIDRDDDIVMPSVGPGDVTNIAVGLLRLHPMTGDVRYLHSVYRALRYSLSVQIAPDSRHPYQQDEKVRWGFWSWQPP